MYTNRLIKGRPHRLQRDQWGEGAIKILHEYNNSMFIFFAHGYASVVSSVYYMGHYNCEDTGDWITSCECVRHLAGKGANGFEGSA